MNWELFRMPLVGGATFLFVGGVTPTITDMSFGEDTAHLEGNNVVLDNTGSFYDFTWNSSSSALGVLNLGGHSNLTSVNISFTSGGGDVTFGTFAGSPIAAMSISGLSLTTLDLSSCNALQNLYLSAMSGLSTLSLSSSALSSITFDSLSSLESLNLTNFYTLSSVTLNNCDGLSALYLEYCSSLAGLTIDNNPSLTILSFVLTITLQTISITNCISLPSIDVSSQTNLSTLTISNCSSINTLTLPDAYSLSSVDISYTSITEIALANLPSLATFNATNCTDLFALPITGCPQLSTVILQDCNLDVTAVDAVLAYLASGSIALGTLNILVRFGVTPTGGSSNADLVTLQGRGWSINYNS